MTATSATNVQDSSKRTADSVGGEGIHRLEKARRTGQFAGPSAYRCI